MVRPIAMKTIACSAGKANRNADISQKNRASLDGVIFAMLIIRNPKTHIAIKLFAISKPPSVNLDPRSPEFQTFQTAQRITSGKHIDLNQVEMLEPVVITRSRLVASLNTINEAKTKNSCRPRFFIASHPSFGLMALT